VIRRATPEDAAPMAALGARMHADSSFSSLSFDENKVRRFLLSLIGSPQGLVLVSERDGALQGGIVGMVYVEWFSNDLVAGDYALYLAPEARNGPTALRLIKEFVALARAKGAKQIRPGVSTGEAGAGAEKLYEHAGFRRVGSLFMMEV
jgi:GNAT superfamily N-acetyltransferase